MIAMIGQAILSGVGILLVLSVFCSMCYPVYRKAILATSLQNRSSFTLSYATLAVVVSIVSTLLLLLPSLSASIIFDHCHRGTCSPHQPETIYASFFGLALMATAASAILIVAALITRSIIIASKKLTLLNKLASKKSRLEADTNYQIVESKDVFAWCAGLIYPRIFISRGLIDQTNQDQLEVIIAHEHCHLEKRDNLRKFLLNWITQLWLPRQKRQIRHDFANWIEQYSNCYASQHIAGVAEKPTTTNPLKLSFYRWDWLQFLLLICQFVIAVTVMTSLSHFLMELVK